MNYWQKVDNLSQIPPDILEFVVLPACKILEKEFVGLVVGSGNYQKEKLFIDFEARGKELLRGTTYRFTAKIIHNILSVSVFELLLDNYL